MSTKTAPQYCVGIDLSDKTFIASLLHTRSGDTHTSTPFPRTEDGCASFVKWMQLHRALKRSTLVAMETTGVLSQLVCHHLAQHGYAVTVIQATRIARSRPASRPKNDATDSLLIADYLSRHLDQITLWTPTPDVIEQLNTLATAR